MPANKKHLTKSPLHRFLKIISGLVGGYAITEALLWHFYRIGTLPAP